MCFWALFLGSTNHEPLLGAVMKQSYGTRLVVGPRCPAPYCRQGAGAVHGSSSVLLPQLLVLGAAQFSFVPASEEQQLCSRSILSLFSPAQLPAWDKLGQTGLSGLRWGEREAKGCMLPLPIPVREQERALCCFFHLVLPKIEAQGWPNSKLQASCSAMLQLRVCFSSLHPWCSTRSTAPPAAVPWNATGW